MNIQEIYNMYLPETRIDNLYQRINKIYQFCDEIESLEDAAPLQKFVKENPEAQMDFQLSKAYNKGINNMWEHVKFPISDILTQEDAFNFFFKQSNVEEFLKELIIFGIDCKSKTSDTYKRGEIIKQISEFQYNGDRLAIHRKLYNEYVKFTTNGKIRNDFNVDMKDFKGFLFAAPNVPIQMTV